MDGQPLDEAREQPWARGVYLRKITRGATATEIPILPDTKINRGDILTLVGRTQDVSTATKALGYPDKQTDVADVMFIGAAIAIGALARRPGRQSRWRAAHAVDLRRRLDRRPVLRLASLRAADIRHDPVTRRCGS